MPNFLTERVVGKLLTGAKYLYDDDVHGADLEGLRKPISALVNPNTPSQYPWSPYKPESKIVGKLIHDLIESIQPAFACEITCHLHDYTDRKLLSRLVEDEEKLYAICEEGIRVSMPSNLYFNLYSSKLTGRPNTENSEGMFEQTGRCLEQPNVNASLAGNNMQQKCPCTSTGDVLHSILLPELHDRVAVCHPILAPDIVDTIVEIHRVGNLAFKITSILLHPEKLFTEMTRLMDKAYKSVPKRMRRKLFRIDLSCLVEKIVLNDPKRIIAAIMDEPDDSIKNYLWNPKYLKNRAIQAQINIRDEKRRRNERREKARKLKTG